jgi:cytochrome oxidase Cu insertion factor (SCO1/SenC/PrrC family)
VAGPGDEPTPTSSATKNGPQYKILWKAILADADAACLSFDRGLLGEIPMNVNDKAPDFTLQDQDGKELSLKDLRGKVVILFFFPRADTPG